MLPRCGAVVTLPDLRSLSRIAPNS